MCSTVLGRAGQSHQVLLTVRSLCPAGTQSFPVPEVESLEESTQLLLLSTHVWMVWGLQQEAEGGCAGVGSTSI